MVEINFKNYSTANLIAPPTEFWAIYNHLSYFTEGAQYSPLFKRGQWDGFTRPMTKKGALPAAILHKVHDYCKSNNIEMVVDKKYYADIGTLEVEMFIDNLPAYSGGKEIFIRDDQRSAVVRALTCRTSVQIAPTSFGKSLSIYYCAMFHLSRGRKTLIIVPTKSLILQMEKDFKDYGYEGEISKISGGTELECSDITIGTYQTLTKHPTFVNKFDYLILDECHKVVAKTVLKIFNQAKSVKYRSGWTGTLEELSENRRKSDIYLGKAKQITTTSSLMEQSVVAQLSIEVIILSHTKAENTVGLDYHEEISYLNCYLPRTQYIIDKIPNESGLVLFNEIAHGEMLHEVATKKYSDTRHIYFIYGDHVERDGVMYKTFEEVKSLYESETDSIIIASYGVFSTGISIKNIRFILLARTVKSVIRLLQSIGRGLRIRDDKTSVKLIDVVDSFIVDNYSFNHGNERVNIYKRNNFNFEISRDNL